MLIIVLNSIFIFLDAGQFRKPESHDRRKPATRWICYVMYFVPFLVVAVLPSVIRRGMIIIDRHTYFAIDPIRLSCRRD
jgi:hypothetical protein